ncbi:MAG TPA: hypothetical protein VIV60_14475 [Polyangiaceae bacterium]
MATSSPEDPEFRRFVEYLQRSLVDGAEPLAENPDELRNWIHVSRKKLERLAAAGTAVPSALVDEYTRLANNFAPETALDSFHARHIFEPVVAEVTQVCNELRLGPARPVRLINSPAVTPSALAWPTSDSGTDHLLFVGVATSAFCNYWGKAFADLLATLSAKAAPQRLFDVDCRALIRSNMQLLALPIRLSVFFAFHDTLAGFGSVIQKSPAVGYRIELVHAMEVFVVAHEFGHFILEERTGVVSSSQSRAMAEERQADALAFAITRHVGSQTNNWHAFSGAAAVAFFCALDICERARAICTTQSSHSDTHPPSRQRLSAMRKMISDCTHKDEVSRVSEYIEEVEAALNALTLELVSEIELLSNSLNLEATPTDTTAV